MIRRFNYTGRKRIPRSKVAISLHEVPGNILAFEASVDLDGLQLPPSAKVYVEAYRRAFFRRFPCGSVSEPRFPHNLTIEGFEPNALVLFRVKIVDTKGRILAVVDKIIPRRTEEEPTDKQCLLPVEFVDLGQAIWRLDVDGELPVLQLNKSIENIREIARSDGFFLPLVYPEVVRQILYRIIVEEDYTEADAQGEDDWMSDWLKFATEMLGSEQLPLSGTSEPVKQDKLKWIEDVVEAFCSNNQVLEKFAKAQRTGES